MHNVLDKRCFEHDGWKRKRHVITCDEKEIKVHILYEMLSISFSLFNLVQASYSFWGLEWGLERILRLLSHFSLKACFDLSRSNFFCSYLHRHFIWVVTFPRRCECNMLEWQKRRNTCIENARYLICKSGKIHSQDIRINHVNQVISKNATNESGQSLPPSPSSRRKNTNNAKKKVTSYHSIFNSLCSTSLSSFLFILICDWIIAFRDVAQFLIDCAPLFVGFRGGIAHAEIFGISCPL